MSGKLHRCTDKLPQVGDELMIATGEDQPMGLADDISSDGGIGQMM